MKLVRSVHLNPLLIFLIPLVDLCFLLLLLFLVSSTFLLHPGISVNLPFSSGVLAESKSPRLSRTKRAAFHSLLAKAR